MNRFEKSCLLLIFAVLFLMLPGCMINYDPHGAAYVTKMGGPDIIGPWTMKQTDGRKIEDGLEALRQQFWGNSGHWRTNAEAEQALNWMWLIVDKIQEGPADRVIPTEHGENFTTQTLLEKFFRKIANSAYHGHKMEVVFYRLRPSEQHPLWFEMWEKERIKLVKLQRERAARNLKM